MKNFYTLIHIENDKCLNGKRFLYNESKYNIHHLDNYLNKFFDIKLRKINFMKKKNTMPIWGFMFPNHGIDLYKEFFDIDLFKTYGIILMVYELDDLDLNNNTLSVSNNKILSIYTLLNKFKVRDSGVFPTLNNIPINKGMSRLLKRVKTNNLFLKGGIDKLDYRNIILPRLRLRNIIGCINAYDLIGDEFTGIKTEEEFLDLLKSKENYSNLREELKEVN